MFESGLELSIVVGSDGNAPIISFRVNVTDVMAGHDATFFNSDEVSVRFKV